MCSCCDVGAVGPGAKQSNIGRGRSVAAAAETIDGQWRKWPVRCRSAVERLFVRFGFAPSHFLGRHGRQRTQLPVDNVLFGVVESKSARAQTQPAASAPTPAAASLPADVGCCSSHGVAGVAAPRTVPLLWLQSADAQSKSEVLSHFLLLPRINSNHA